ncbi:MAG TPA: glycosyltransferase [Candidatus Limnocylindrales bacterium]|nr:glycosyltransferase [Candidatus Limnocylindrales bacterium]
MTRPEVPPPILRAARDRARARRERDWATADRLRAEIEAAGWKVVDRGTEFRLEPSHPPTVEEGGVARYGSSAAVPSRLDDTPVGVASVVLVATDWIEDVVRAVGALAGQVPDGTQVIVVANDPTDGDGPIDALSALETLDRRDPGAPGVVTELVRTSARLGHAAALNVGVRRASAPVVVLVDPSVEATGDVITPLVRTLDDPTVAVAGPFGIVSSDLRRFEEAPEGVVDVDAIEGYALAFRRADYVERGPFDEHFTFYRNLDIWWSLVLRDEGEGERPRRAVRVPGLPVRRHEHRAWAVTPEAERDRLSKKNFYRVLKRFATRGDLLVSGPGSPRRA